MFFYPEPEPIGYCITNVSPSYLMDGIFFNGREIGPTHKCVAKQLSPIPRDLNDPVASIPKINNRTLDRWTIDSKAWYVDNCGRNSKALYSMMKILPIKKIDLYAGWKSNVAIFPRSEQYEYSYIRNMRIKEVQNRLKEEEEEKKELETVGKKCLEMDLNPSESRAAFEYTKIPIWWKDKIPNRIQCTVGIPDDYGYEKLDNTDIENRRTELKNSDEKKTQKNSVSIDAVKAKINSEDEYLENIENCECLKYKSHKSLLCNMNEKRDVNNSKRADEINRMKLDPRWHSVRDVCDLPRNDSERNKAMLNLFKPYNHEINTWYSINKPTKIFF